MARSDPTPPQGPNSRRQYYWPLLLALANFCASGQSQLATPSLDWVISKDKIAHFLVFGLLATSLMRMVPLRNWGWKGAVCATVITSMYGGLDEFRQSFTPGRSVEIADWIADTLGAITASFVYLRWQRYQKILEYRSIRISADHTDQSASAESPE